jgi:tetratricopeptide (TPR) repeat protein
MILAIAAALAAAQPAPCPDVVTADAFVCRAIRASADQKPAEAAEAFEQAAQALEPSDPQVARLLAAAGNMWIAADRPGKAALALDRAVAGSGLQGPQRGEALLDRARAAEAQNDLKTARAKISEAAQTIAEDPFLWYFSAALAIREGDSETAKSSIGRALTLAPGDPTILFEAGHVAQFTGDTVGARHYWTRVIELDPNGVPGRAARDALKLLPAQVTVQGKPEETK